MNFRDKFRSPQWFKFQARIFELRGRECENCDSDAGCRVLPKGYIRGLEPWDYPPNHVRVLCEECFWTIKRRGNEFAGVCDTLPGMTLAYVLDGVELFTHLLDEHAVLAEDFYCCLKGNWRVTVPAADCPPFRATKSDVKNSLLALRTDDLDPILDGLDIIKKLPEDEQLARTMPLRPLLFDCAHRRREAQEKETPTIGLNSLS